MLNNSASKPKHRHQTSMDNFIKNIKKHNQRSERYMSPLLYMYSRNHTTNTIDKSRSRTLSNRKSSVGAVSKTKRKLQKILKEKKTSSLTERNPAYIIEECGNKLKKIEKYLEKKNQIAHYLCQNFLKMLNEIVEKMVKDLDAQLQGIENKAARKIEAKYQKQLEKLERQNAKLSSSLQQSLQKLDNNSSLIYHIRLLSELDVDYIYGKCILGTEQCGGFGYGKANQSQASQEYEHHQGQPEDSMSSGMSRYRKELFQFEELSEEHHESRKDHHLYKQTTTKQRKIFEKVQEGAGEKESGRIRPAQDWQKKNVLKRQQTQNKEDDASYEEVYRPFGRRLT